MKRNCENCSTFYTETLFGAQYAFMTAEGKRYYFCTQDCKEIFSKTKLPLLNSNYIHMDEFKSINDHEYFVKFKECFPLKTTKKLNYDRKKTIAEFKEWLFKHEAKIKQDEILKAEANNSKLSVLESATLSLKLVKEHNLHDIRSVLEILSSHEEINSVIDDKNNELKDQYKNSIEEIYNKKGIKNSDSYYDIHFDLDLKNCMRLGKNKLLAELDDVLPKSIENNYGTMEKYRSKRTISKSKKWKDLKD